jgi:hypothetical protein
MAEFVNITFSPDLGERFSNTIVGGLRVQTMTILSVLIKRSSLMVWPAAGGTVEKPPICS